MPVLAEIGRSGAGTALGWYGEFDTRSVACTSLYFVVGSDDRHELVAKADAAGLVDATVAIAKSLTDSQEKLAVCHESGISQTLLDVSRTEGFEERLKAALGVEDLQMGLLPDSYWE